MGFMQTETKRHKKTQGSRNKNNRKTEGQGGGGVSLKRRISIFALTLAIAAGIPMAPPFVQKAAAAENTEVKIEQTGGYFATQGDNNVALKVKITNNDDEDITFAAKTGLSATTGDIREPNPNSGKTTLAAGESTEAVFTLNISGSASTGSHSINIVLIDKGENYGDVLRSKSVTMTINKKSATSGTGSGTSLPAAELVHSLSGGDAIVAGKDNTLTLTFSNSGNTVMKDAKVSLTLPEGLYINNGSNTASVGYVTIGTTKTVAFHLTADTDLDSKNYPVTVTISFKDKSSAAQTIEQTLYLPVEASGSSSLSDVEITGVSLPDQAKIGEDFTLSFSVKNTGKSATGKLKIYAEAPEGMLNRTQSVFSVSSIAAGDSVSYSVTFFSKDDAAEQNYAIKIAAESAKSDDTASVIQYAGIYLADGGSGKVKTPQLMVSNYSYGGTFVQAGDEFRLELDLQNTSASQTLRNIKVTIESTDGVFVPVGASNSFYIDEIVKKDSAAYSLFLVSKPDAEQKTTPINVNMAYEDTSGNAYTATDVISIPVMQDTRLVVDEIAAPPELYAGMQTNVPVSFYNMGKTVLNNLRIRAEGDFDLVDAASYYVGNMTAGDSDSYDLAFIPRAVGPMLGKVVFTYEDASGNEQIIEKEFSFEIMDMPIYEEELMPGEETGTGSFPWLPVGIGVALAAAGGGFFFWRRRRRLKIHEEMEIDE